MLTLLTATGCRQGAWEICERLMMAQTYAGPVRWVIVDDGPEMQTVRFHREGWTVEIIRPDHVWTPGQNTQALNLLAGLAVIPSDASVVVIEDDDYYAPEWLATVDQWLHGHELVGEGMARYYNVASMKYQQLNNGVHASLCSTAMRGHALELFRKCCKPDVQYIDLTLWRTFTGMKCVHKNTRLTVGTKGLPGRMGIGMGHKDTFGQPDKRGDVLRQWVGDEMAGIYDRLFNRGKIVETEGTA